MTGRKRFGLLAAMVLAAGLLLGGCGNKAQTEREAYGVADLETLVKAHPAYSEYFKLQTEYEDLLHRYRNEQRSLLHLSETQRKMKAALSSKDAEKAAEEEYKARVKIREDTLNRQLQTLYQEISARHSRQPSHPELTGGSADENTQIANLHLKLKILNIGGEEKSQAESQLKDLLNGRRGELQQDGWTEAEKQEFEDKRQKAKAELEAYAAQVAAEIHGRRLKSQAAAASVTLPDADRWNSQWETRVKEKQKEMADKKEKIMEDIRDKAAIIGEKKHLAMIFSSYRVNVDAEDVTGDIANELVQIR